MVESGTQQLVLLLIENSVLL